jgi:hypothetical protein
MNVSDFFFCLQMDEIHVNPTLAFKGGNVLGHAQKSADQAHSVQAFMISSVFGHIAEISVITSREEHIG